MLYVQIIQPNRSLNIESSYILGYRSNRSLTVSSLDNQDNNPKRAGIGAFDPVSIARKTHLTMTN